VPVVDTNVGRVLARAFLGAASAGEAGLGAVALAAEALLPRDGARARDHNLALMDLGAAICTSRNPRCDACPLSTRCAWRAAGAPASPPSLRPPVRFEATARFARGRILDHLRKGPARFDDLSAALPGSHRAKLQVYLEALSRDGLAVRLSGETWALPGDQGSSSIASPKE
jgi:A/G-specific adenine glycosylase